MVCLKKHCDAQNNDLPNIEFWHDFQIYLIYIIWKDDHLKNHGVQKLIFKLNREK